MKNHVGRNSPCPCGSGKKYKKCCAQNGENGCAVLEVNGYSENVCGVFRYVPETHIEGATGKTYNVRVYSSVLDLVENNDEVKQLLCVATHSLLFECDSRHTDVVFVNGTHLGLSDDILIWHDRDAQHVMWFTVTQAKSHFGPHYEPMFGKIERLPWSRAEEAVLQNIASYNDWVN